MQAFSFRELSALGSATAVAIAGGLYFPDAFRIASALAAGTISGFDSSGLLGVAIGLVVTLIVIQVVSHILIAILYRDEANEPRDERDRLIGMKAGRAAYGVLAFGVAIASGHVLMSDTSGLLAAQYMLLALFIAEFVNYGSRFVLYRMSV